jgi:hypothetical protein
VRLGTIGVKDIVRKRKKSIDDGFRILIELCVQTFTPTSYGKKGNINYRVVLHQNTMHAPLEYNMFQKDTEYLRLLVYFGLWQLYNILCRNTEIYKNVWFEMQFLI